MKRFAVGLVSSILAFTAGLVTASSWSLHRDRYVDPRPVASVTTEPCAPGQQSVRAALESYSVTPPREFEFGHNGLKLVPERVQLTSESLGYRIDVSYPQILATPYTDVRNIKKVNQHLKDTATKLYDWPTTAAAQAEQRNAKSGIRNTVLFTYQVSLSTDSVLSVKFVGYGFNGVTTTTVQDNFTLNYDLTTGRALELAEIFRGDSQHLGFISRYSTRELGGSANLELNHEGLEAKSKNFRNWLIAPSGISFDFPACQVAACSVGELTVLIPFEVMKPLLQPDVPSKFYITYP